MNTQELCAICLDSIMEERVALEECNHVFCKLCIDKWTDFQSKCPVCKKGINLPDTKKASGKKPVSETDEQFECFDHVYFRAEFLKLQKKLDDTRFALQKNPKLNKITDCWSFLEMLALEITQKMKVLAGSQKFNAKEYLEDVTRIDKSLKDIGSGKEIYGGLEFYGEETKDYYDEEEEDYDSEYYCGEEAYSDDEDGFYGFTSDKTRTNNRQPRTKTDSSKKTETGTNKSNKARTKC